MDENKENSFRLGDIQVSPSHNTLAAGGQTIKLQPKAMAVLHYLACHHNRVISNEELIERLWEGRIVTHGSVQKSINALRSAFSELIGDREIIVHYSKRGYQLKLEPQCIPSSSPDLLAIEANSSPAIPKPRRHLRVALWLLALAAIAGVLLVYGLSSKPRLVLSKNHTTVFHTIQGYTNETGHERNATPHPDNKHVAYIREAFSTAHTGETESEILIRNAAGKDWRIVHSNGSWFRLAWSPAGKNLVAVEVKRRDGPLLGPNFFEKPNYLYSFHIFSLDLANERLVEKQLLSQWQGRIFSVTWWDENILEIVAKQGPNSGNGRYRYSILDQQLKLMDEQEGITNPVASAVQNKITAVANSVKNRVQIHFLNEGQQHISRWTLDFPSVDISWIPDGSGILVYVEEERKLFTLYLDGQKVNIPVADSKDKVFSRPRYRPDGKAIYYTEEKRSSNIGLAALDGTKTWLTDNTDLNYAASFSPKGDKLVYASVRNNQIHLWLVESGQERQLTSEAIPRKVGAIIWSEAGDYLLFNAGTRLYAYSFLTAETSLLLSDNEKIEPVGYFPAAKKLLILKTNRDTRNLWRIDLQTGQQKQLTFGSVGSAIEYEGDVLFQYVGESSLWVVRNKDDSLAQITPDLGANNKLLQADKAGIYFISGGACHESDIQYFNYTTATQSTFLARGNNIVATTSFNASRGALQTDCYVPEANIVLLK